LRIYLFALIISSTFFGCSLQDNDSFNPAYLIIDSVDLVTTSDQGYASHQITDIWISIDERNLGVYTLPARIPIIVSGEEMNIRINAGVKPNGTKNQSLPYPFYDPIELEMNLSEGEEFKYEPTFNYRSDARFDIVEDFENSTLFIKDLDGNIETFVTRSDQEKNGGNFSGLIELANDKRIAEFTTNTEFLSSNNSGGATFLEFDYLSDVNLVSGYIVETDHETINGYVAVFFPNNEWTRVYIDLTDFVATPQVNKYQITFLMEHEGTGTSQIFLDNVKLVHF
jgi:hypothetical protein